LSNRNGDIDYLEEDYMTDHQYEEDEDFEAAEKLLSPYVEASLQRVFGSRRMIGGGESEPGPPPWQQTEEPSTDIISLDEDFREAYEEADAQIATTTPISPPKAAKEDVYPSEALVEQMLRQGRERTLRELEEDKILVLRKVINRIYMYHNTTSHLNLFVMI